jgi:hypothetical protein
MVETGPTSNVAKVVNAGHPYESVQILLLAPNRGEFVATPAGDARNAKTAPVDSFHFPWDFSCFKTSESPHKEKAPSLVHFSERMDELFRS